MAINLPKTAVAACLFLTASQTMALRPEMQPYLYVSDASASVFATPQQGAKVAGSIPIGTAVKVVGDPKQLIANPSIRPVQSEASNAQSCPMPAKADSDDWLCIRVDTLVVDGFGHDWGGWVKAGVLAPRAPRLDELLARYTITPKASRDERRKWAERAVALDPSSAKAQDSLLESLNEPGAHPALAQTALLASSYRHPAVTLSSRRLIFAFNEGSVEPIAEFKAGKISAVLTAQEIQEFKASGQVYAVYARGANVGTLVTVSEFDCAVRACANIGIVRRLTGPARQRGLALNFSLPPTSIRPPEVTRRDTRTMSELAGDWINVNRTGGVRKAMLGQVKHGGTISAGQLSSGKTVVFASWVVGSMNDEHDGGPGDVHESLLLIGERNVDGTIQLAPGSGSIKENGCAYFDHADIDGDGSDELVLRCEQLEGSYDYQILKNIAGAWKQAAV